MSPINVAIAGLSANSTSSWAEQAHLPHLRASDQFKIVALLNSSKPAAEAAIKHFELAPDTKAYGSPEELAQDADIQLVVIATRVDKHYAAVKPSIIAGKHVFVEWPLAGSTKDAQELVDLAQKSGSQVIVGLQGQASAVVRVLREVIASGKIGKVLTSTLTAYGPQVAPVRNVWFSAAEYYLHRQVGGNFVTILGGHLLNSIHAVLGEYKTLQSNSQLLRPQVPMLDTGNVVTTDVPDQFTVYGSLESGAHLLVYLSSQKQVKGAPNIDWRIHGERGELRLSAENLSFGSFDSDDVKIELQPFDTETIEPIPVHRTHEELPAVARQIASIYDAYASGTADGRYATGELALKRHRELDQIFADFDAAQA